MVKPQFSLVGLAGSAFASKRPPSALDAKDGDRQVGPRDFRQKDDHAGYAHRGAILSGYRRTRLIILISAFDFLGGPPF